MPTLTPWRRLALYLALGAALCFREAAWAAAAEPAQTNTRFSVIAFHDVVDPGQPADFDAVSLDQLIAFLDWVKADGWSVITADDVTAASEGRKSLPAKAILLSFDDGYESFYSRVYPLLLAYRFPAVLSLVASWMEQPPRAMVDYGGRMVSREHFLTWDQVRRMRASGLIEVASHSYDLHRTIPINRQGNVLGAPRAWLFDPALDRAETDEEQTARISADLALSRRIIARETGAAPHILVWPYGRFSGPAVTAATSLGFDQIYTLTHEQADARDRLNIPRYYPTGDPNLGEIVENLEWSLLTSPTVRAVCVDLAPLAEARDPAGQDAVLGRLVEDLRRLGANIVVIDAMRFSPDGARPAASWVPTALMPVESDVLSRAARQLGLRAGVDVYVRLRLPMLIEAFGEKGAVELAQQAARAAPLTGLALEGGGGSAAPGEVAEPAAVRAVRAGADAASSPVLRVMREVARIDPQLRLMVLADGSEETGPPPGADMILWPAAPDAREAAAQAARLKAAGWFKPGISGRILLRVPAGSATSRAQAMGAMQAQGVNSLALCPWAPGDSEILAPAFSAASFPHRP